MHIELKCLAFSDFFYFLFLPLLNLKMFELKIGIEVTVFWGPHNAYTVKATRIQIVVLIGSLYSRM